MMLGTNLTTVLSSRAKGGRSRRKCEDYLRSKGYLVANVEKGGKFTAEKDLFALSQEGEYSDKGFDLIALSKGSIIFVQCKTNKPASSQFYKDFAKQYADGYVEVLVMTVEDYKGIRLQWYESDGSIIEDYVDSKDVPKR